ncbi:hypothetical protein CALCODRAFT_495940 [Calocera cornea HHB12733]|uniref:Uncharacterized protein n=1 Tax=Calocera cornea HHB12733 TaxID=1353952 RepID=A0A165G7I2_9BASI|nr:hypothetical protein CALCODRAFT_495940 [Calocera cornea HHB12733]
MTALIIAQPVVVISAWNARCFRQVPDAVDTDRQHAVNNSFNNSRVCCSVLQHLCSVCGVAHTPAIGIMFPIVLKCTTVGRPKLGPKQFGHRTVFQRCTCALPFKQRCFARCLSRYRQIPDVWQPEMAPTRPGYGIVVLLAVIGKSNPLTGPSIGTSRVRPSKLFPCFQRPTSLTPVEVPSETRDIPVSYALAVSR